MADSSFLSVRKENNKRPPSTTPVKTAPKTPKVSDDQNFLSPRKVNNILLFFLITVSRVMEVMIWKSTSMQKRCSWFGYFKQNDTWVPCMLTFYGEDVDMVVCWQSQNVLSISGIERKYDKQTRVPILSGDIIHFVRKYDTALSIARNTTTPPDFEVLPSTMTKIIHQQTVTALAICVCKTAPKKNKEGEIIGWSVVFVCPIREGVLFLFNNAKVCPLSIGDKLVVLCSKLVIKDDNFYLQNEAHTGTFFNPICPNMHYRDLR